MTRFTPVTSQPDWPVLEHEMLDFWSETGAFEALVERNSGGERWSFQDGPITANNPMGVHHAWGRTYKDAWQRYKAMNGYDLRWQNGFDCQGLWVEVNVEREMGFGTKRDIEAHGIAPFVRRCKERVLRMAALQTIQSIRLGMWMHWDDPDQLRWLADNVDRDEPVTVEAPGGRAEGTVEQLIGKLGHHPWNGSYFTFSDINNFMIWHYLKECHRRGFIYQGTDVMPWCGRCGTGLSQHEIATEGYRETSHLSPTLRFPLVGRPGESLLIWTTTPWTLTSNVAAAVGPELTYLQVRQGDETFYLAEGAAPNALEGEFQVGKRMKGEELLGWRYEGPYDELPAQEEARRRHEVIAWDEVGEEEGTGIVHIAPGCGAEDFELGRDLGLPAVAPLDEDGRFIEGFDWLTGNHALEVTEQVLNDLGKKGLLYRAESYLHRYPVCWRCQSELVFRLVDEWYISMGEVYDKPRDELTPDEKESSLRYQIMDVVDAITWIPSYGREREHDWLRNMSDWMISKKRYWGLALPIWRCPDCGWFDVIGGRDELKEKAIEGWEVLEGHSPHRPYVDAVKVRCGSCGGVAERIPDVGDPWLDAGIVPFSTAKYAEDRSEWEKWFPADFICESLPGQFRNWFYSLLAMSTVLARREPFQTVLGYATLFAEEGREMHKSWGNAIEFNEAAERMGVDVMRWMYMTHKPEQNLNFGYGPGAEVRRRFLIPLWSVYAFLVQYANVADGWEPPLLRLDGGEEPGEPEGEKRVGSTPVDEAWSQLDRWMEARLQSTIADVTVRMEGYDGRGATMVIESLVEDLSNWYIRRSRRRFWDGEPAALDTLYKTVVTLTRLVAPFIPFTAEAIYQNLVASVSAEAPPSVHLTRWPRTAKEDAVGTQLLTEMSLVIRLAGLGRAARSSAGIKLRQPLARATAAVRTDREAEAVTRLGEHLAQELNVKAVDVVTDEGALVTYDLRPALPVLGPKYGSRVPAIREALRVADASAVAAKVEAGEPVPITCEGDTVLLLPEEIEVVAVAREGLATAEEQGYVVGVATELTDELAAEGLARDLVRHIQQLRKDSNLDITDRISLSIQCSGATRGAVENWRDYIMGEVLALHLSFEAPSDEVDGSSEIEVGDAEATIAVTRVAT